jgi:hypothetical protein
MPYVIRKVDAVTKWELGDKYDSKAPIKADPIGELKTTEDTLSVYVVDELYDESENKDIEHIVIACATNREFGFDKFACVIANMEELLQNGISMDPSPDTGLTPVEKANKQHWNIINLKASDLEKLARIFLNNVNDKRNIRKVPLQKVKQFVSSKIGDSNYIDITRVKPKVIEELNRDRFLNVYKKLPEELKAEIIYTPNPNPFSWDTAHKEIKKGTAIGNEILNELINSDRISNIEKSLSLKKQKK